MLLKLAQVVKSSRGLGRVYGGSMVLKLREEELEE